MPAISSCVGVPPGICDALVPNGESYCDDCREARRKPHRQHPDDAYVAIADQAKRPSRKPRKPKPS